MPPGQQSSAFICIRAVESPKCRQIAHGRLFKPGAYSRPLSGKCRSRGGGITGIAPTGRHGPPGTWGDLLEHNKTITVLDLSYSQHADPIWDVEVKTPTVTVEEVDSPAATCLLGIANLRFSSPLAQVHHTRRSDRLGGP